MTPPEARPSEGENYVVERGRPEVPVLILCEHAAKAVPEDIDLGVPPELLDSHWGWDRWAWDTLRAFARPLGATTLGAQVSRLVLDVNRGPADAGLIREEAGGRPIPGNRGLEPSSVEERVRRFHASYHDAAGAELGRLLEQHGRRLLFFTFHTFTGEMGDEDRDFDVGVLFDAYEDLAAGVREALAVRGLRARLNEPYSGFRGEMYSAAAHGKAHDVPYFEIEVNQHVLEDPDDRRRIAGVFEEVVRVMCPGAAGP